jgi:hypothetical protein
MSKWDSLSRQSSAANKWLESYFNHG